MRAQALSVSYLR